MKPRLCLLLALACQAVSLPSRPANSSSDPQVTALAEEVRTKGWVIFSARSPAGDWDLSVCRPDGSDLRPVTRSPAWNEFSPLISRDGTRLIYRRIPRPERIDNNRHGEQGELVLADVTGSNPRVIGPAGKLSWATWSPDGSQLASLSIKGISFIRLSDGQLVRSLSRKGFFQQTTWSPDGKWICGVANSFGTGWSIAKMDVATGEISAINKVDCCTPDWFPNSEAVIFSWRPRDQNVNNGYGWTQLWRANLDGTSRQLVYGEDGRHVYGGNVSPDGVYVLFTGNMQEDGDPGGAGGPMGLMRLKDGPIIGGESRALRARHAEAKSGPVLELPAGWEPYWTSASLAAASSTAPGKPLATTAPSSAPPAESLRRELHNKGWIVFSVKTDRGDWDLFLARPDGSDQRRITDTPETSEAGARFDPSGQRLLYYRMPKATAVDNNTYGTFDLVIANANGSAPVVYGKDFPWASWSSDSAQIGCLTPKGIQIVELKTRAVVRAVPRKGIVSQLIWSPDGKRFVGTANGLGPFWNIGCLDPITGQLKALSETERYNCTPDWRPDSAHVIYARGIIPQHEGRAELWVADADGANRRRIYAEEGRHIYGACSSPDGAYVLFTRSVEDLGQVVGTEMAIIRWPGSDRPASVTERVDLGSGWEPHWTAADVR